MSLFTWSSIYSVGIEQIDRQHRALIDRMNALYDCHTREAPTSRTLAALDELIAYTVKHFNWEEDAMRKAGYADFEAHAKHHAKLIEQIQQIHDQLQSGARTLDDNLMNFFKNWLQGHILGVDKKYSATLKAHQSTHPQA